VNHSVNAVVLNPLLADGTYAANHNTVYDDYTYGTGILLSGIRMIREPGTGNEIVLKPKTLILGKHTSWNPGAVATITSVSTDITINGVYTTDIVEVFARYGGGSANPTGCLFYGYVRAPDVVSVTIFNATAGNKAFDDTIPLDIYVYRPGP